MGLVSSRFIPLSLLLCSLFSVYSLSAQERFGSITGHAVDRAGAVLQGARVEIQPKGITTTTNAQGGFTITGLLPGDYAVQVSYIGFSPYTNKVTVSAGQTARVDAELKVASTAMEITVTSERVHGEVEAINRQLESDNILQVLPVEVITSLPNTNIADALGRLPSVTLERDEGEGKYVQIRGTQPAWNNVTVNGVNVPSPESGVRQVKLDIIPANLVESVEINKTLSANQDGDAIGGSVNLVTKAAEEKPTLYINGIGGYTPIIGGRSLYEIDGTVGKRFGANKKLGVLFGSSYDWNGRGIDDVEPVPSAIQCDAGPTGCVNPTSTAPFFVTYPTEDLREYRYYRTRYGFTGSVDYKLGEISGLFIRGIYSHFDNFGDRWVYTPTINTFQTPSQGDTEGNMSFNTQIRRPVEVIGSLDFGGKHVFTKWMFNWDASVARASSEDHGYSSADFNGPSGIQFGVDTTNPYKPKLLAQGAGASVIYDPTQYTLADLDVGRTYSPQVNLQGAFSAARNYTWGGHFGTFEFGAKLRNAHKFQDQNDPVYNVVAAAPPTMQDLLGNFTNSNYYDKSYTLGPTVDYNKVLAYFNANAADPNTIQLDAAGTTLDTYSNSFSLVERITAGYAMNTINFGRFRLQTGLRFEATHEGLRGNLVGLDSSGNPTVSPLVTDHSYLDPMPSVQLRYRLTNAAGLRASYGRGIARPDFGDLPPTFDPTNAPRISVGNPKLKPTHANNFDLLYEQDLKPVGLLQAGFFYKQISDPIYPQQAVIGPTQTAQNPLLGNYAGDFLSQAINGSRARIYGFEIAYLQHLTFLPGALAGIGISANYGYSNSSTDGVPLRSDHPPLARQAPNTWNLSPTFDRWRISARLGISHNDANVFSYNYQNLEPDPNSGTGFSPVDVPLGIRGPNGDTYLYAHTQVDAQAAIRMYRGLQLIVSGLNLTNEVFGFYNGSKQYPIQREYYKSSYMFGLRYTLSNEPH
jgi:TonB-dependent receptor